MSTVDGLGLLAFAPTNWTPGLLVLGVGIAVAVLILFSTRKPAGPVPSVRDEKLADLEQRLQLLLDQLRGLEAERHQLGDAFGSEKARLERDAAAAMRARDEYLQAHPEALRVPAPTKGPQGSPSPAPASTGAASGAGVVSPQLKGALWGAGVVLFFVGVGFALSKWQGDRGEDGIMTGRTPPGAEVASAAGANPQEHPGLSEALARAKADPRDLEAASFAAHELIRLQRFDEAAVLTHQSLAVDPFHVESRVHRAVLQATEGQFRPSLEELGMLARTYPDAWEAHLFRGRWRCRSARRRSRWTPSSTSSARRPRMSTRRSSRTPSRRCAGSSGSSDVEGTRDRRFGAVIFDLDGTLADTLGDIGEAMNAALAQMGHPTHDLETFRKLVGEGVEHLAIGALPPDRPQDVPELVRHFRRHYADHAVPKSRAFPGVPELLEALCARGLRTAVLSNKLDALTKQVVAVCLGDWPLQPVYGERTGVARKPDPAAALGIASELGVLPERCLFVGDTAVDMKTAESAGMFGVGVLWGFRGRDELASNGAKAIIAQPSELLALID